MPRRVNQVDRVVFPGKRNAGRVDGDPSFLLLLVVVCGRVATVHRAQTMNRPGVIENMLGGGGFARIDVGDHTQIADAGKRRLAGHGGIRGRGASSEKAEPPPRGWSSAC